MRKIFIPQAISMLALLLTMVAFVASGSHASYADAPRPAAVPASVTVDDNPLIEDTTGNFIATINGRGLHRNTIYILTDNNFLCIDSINAAGSLVALTDLEGRFSLTFLGGPSFFGGRPCLSGKFMITARVAGLPGHFLTTTFKVQPPASFGNIATLTLNANPVVISTNGAFKSTLYGKGWHAGKAFWVLFVTSPCCLANFSTTSTGIVDGDGNFAVGISGVVCNAGTAKLLVVVGNSAHLITLHLAPPSR